MAFCRNIVMIFVRDAIDMLDGLGAGFFATAMDDYDVVVFLLCHRSDLQQSNDFLNAQTRSRHTPSIAVPSSACCTGRHCNTRPKNLLEGAAKSGRKAGYFGGGHSGPESLVFDCGRVSEKRRGRVFYATYTPHRPR
jgi:hypothetical protein